MMLVLTTISALILINVLLIRDDWSRVIAGITATECQHCAIFYLLMILANTAFIIVVYEGKEAAIWINVVFAGLYLSETTFGYAVGHAMFVVIPHLVFLICLKIMDEQRRGSGKNDSEYGLFEGVCSNLFLLLSLFWYLKHIVISSSSIGSDFEVIALLGCMFTLIPLNFGYVILSDDWSRSLKWRINCEISQKA